MSSYCNRIGCNCKYRDEEGCLFFSQGSGNEIDMPCYEEDGTISALYKIQELCKELDIYIEINRDCLIFKRYGEINGRQYRYNQAFSVFEIEKRFQNLYNCADEFMTRMEKEKREVERGVKANDKRIKI